VKPEIPAFFNWMAMQRPLKPLPIIATDTSVWLLLLLLLLLLASSFCCVESVMRPVESLVQLVKFACDVYGARCGKIPEGAADDVVWHMQ
jgi:hypothetical protein